jgi:hypothetical protein
MRNIGFMSLFYASIGGKSTKKNSVRIVTLCSLMGGYQCAASIFKAEVWGIGWFI